MTGATTISGRSMGEFFVVVVVVGGVLYIGYLVIMGIHDLGSVTCDECDHTYDDHGKNGCMAYQCSCERWYVDHGAY